jgi:hypothetical protein
MIEVQPPFSKLNLIPPLTDDTYHTYKWLYYTQTQAIDRIQIRHQAKIETIEHSLTKAISTMRAEHTAALDLLNQNNEDDLADYRNEFDHLRASRRHFKKALTSLRHKFHDMILIRNQRMRIIRPVEIPANSANTVCALLTVVTAHLLFRASNY